MDICASAGKILLMYLDLTWNLPGGPVVKNPSAGGLGSIPSQGTRSHTLQLKFLHAATKIRDPACLN